MSNQHPRISFCVAAALALCAGAATAQVSTSEAIWQSGEAGIHLDDPVPNYFEGNLARRPGAVAIAKDVLPDNPSHTIDHLNDGVYGNGNSWIGGSADAWAGIDLGKKTRITSFAFGRDNRADAMTDRVTGEYKIQSAIEHSANADHAWLDLATVTISAAPDGQSLSHRHHFELLEPVVAEAIRIIVPAGAAIDEIELYDATPPTLTSPWLVEGRFGQALAGGIAAPHWAEAGLEPVYQDRPLTVEAWVKLESAVPRNVLVAAGSKQFSSFWMLATEQGSGHLIAYLHGDFPPLYPSTTNIVDGAWHHVAMQLENDHIRLFVDGAQVYERVLARGSWPNAYQGAFYIGAYPPEHLGCDGVIDEVRLTRGIREIAAVPLQPFEADADTVGLWHFDHCAEGAYPDGSAASNHAELAPPPAKLTMDLTRGVTIDRQYREIREPMFTAADIALIKSLGFEFVKIVSNPQIHKLGDALIPESMPMLEDSIALVVEGGLPVVVDIHPEPAFKFSTMGNPVEFESYLRFLDAYCRFLAERWTPDELVFQLMTEPFGAYEDWTVQQYRMWEVSRAALPGYTIILEGDQSGLMWGLLNTHPVNDPDVMYSFTTYDPFVFAFQGFPGFGWPFKYLAHVPYPVDPEIMEAALPGILEAAPEEERARLEAELRKYGKQRWNGEKLARRYARLADWNRFFGGSLRLWCAEFGCLPGTEGAALSDEVRDYGGARPEDRYAFIRDMIAGFGRSDIGWSYWAYNSVFTVLAPVPVREPFAPEPQASWADPRMLEILFGSETTGATRTADTAGLE